MNFCDKQEKKDFEYLRKYNEKYNWFQTITATKKYSGTDAMAVDYSSNTIDIEMKERFKEYPDVFIEPKKFYELTQALDKGNRALYINFFNSGSTAWVFSLSQDMEVEYVPKIKVWDEAIKKHKEVARFKIPKKYAKIYKL